MENVDYRSLDFIGFPCHRIGSDGTVWSCAKKWKIGKWRLVRQVNSTGYRAVTLTRKGFEKQIKVHRLVLLAFVGPCPEGMHGCHNDGDRWNNNQDNLRWDTPKENGKDKILHGRSLVGVKNHKAKVTETKVRTIRRLYATGCYSQESIGKIYGIGQDQVSSIVRFESWPHVK